MNENNQFIRPLTFIAYLVSNSREARCSDVSYSGQKMSYLPNSFNEELGGSHEGMENRSDVECSDELFCFDCASPIFFSSDFHPGRAQGHMEL